jgi:hypothetical protein
MRGGEEASFTAALRYGSLLGAVALRARLPTGREVLCPMSTAHACHAELVQDPAYSVLQWTPLVRSAMREIDVGELNTMAWPGQGNRGEYVGRPLSATPSDKCGRERYGRTEVSHCNCYAIAARRRSDCAE